VKGGEGEGPTNMYSILPQEDISSPENRVREAEMVMNQKEMRSRELTNSLEREEIRQPLGGRKMKIAAWNAIGELKLK
jgi:hypothetical protein